MAAFAAMRDLIRHAIVLHFFLATFINIDNHFLRPAFNTNSLPLLARISSVQTDMHTALCLNRTDFFGWCNLAAFYTLLLFIQQLQQITCRHGKEGLLGTLLFAHSTTSADQDLKQVVVDGLGKYGGRNASCTRHQGVSTQYLFSRDPLKIRFNLIQIKTLNL